MNTRRALIALSLSLALTLVSAPAHAIGPQTPLDGWYLRLVAWAVELLSPAAPEAAGTLDPNGGLTSLTANAGGCLDPNGKPTACSPTPTATTDAGGCLDPNGKPVPCNP